MSQENVELADQVFDAVTRRDLSRLIELTDPEIEWHSFFALGDPEGVYRGHDRMRRYLSDLDDVWEIMRPEVDDTLHVGHVVVLVGRIHYRGKGSGVETKSPVGWMLKFREGRVVSFRPFREPEQAFEAIGLSEQDGHSS
jgi:ketosteroid isomerase-like protein